MKIRLILPAVGAVLVAGVIGTAAATAHGRLAKATIAAADGSPLGTVEFRTERGHLQVRARLTGAPGVEAFHGFHIHANDVPANGDGCIADAAAAPSTWFASADGHYNPAGVTHAHHAGDMPVMYVSADGTAEARFQMDRVDPGGLDGKVVIFHAGADNYANVPLGSSATQYTANSTDATAATARTGNAGDRLGCGVITER